MKFCAHVFAVLTWGMCLSSDNAVAQAVAVQQPAVGIFSVDTVVSVPDRGRMFLGGVNSAGSQRSSYGFGPGQQSVFSQFANSSGLDVGVYIVDFEAMDQVLLHQSPARTTAALSVPHAEDEWLYQERRRPIARQVFGASAGAAGGTARDAPSDHGPSEAGDAAQLAAFYLERGRSAESKGKSGAAVLCYRMAVKYGSRDATERLTALGAK
jgi:hypothetical protein